MRLLKPIIAGVLLVALAACQITTGETSVGLVEPGDKSPDTISAGSLYKQICTDTAPSFRGAVSELESLPFVQHPETGTYYHQNLNLSIKLIETDSFRQCSMLIGVRNFKSSEALLLAVYASGENLNATIGRPSRQGNLYYVPVIGRTNK